MFWHGKWNSFHFSKSFAMWHRYDEFNKMKIDRMMKIKIPVGIHKSKRMCTSMFLFARRRSIHEIDTSFSWCSRKWWLVKHDLHFRAFFLASPVFLTILEPGTLGLFRLERNLNVIWDKKIYNIHLSLCKALVPSKSKFLLVFHALTVCDTTSFSAGHGIAKILKIFAFFFSLKGTIVVIETMK